MSSAGRPVKLKTTLMRGMLMFGKMSVGVRKADAVPKIRISTAMTMNVYGRRKASRTIPIIGVLPRERCSSRSSPPMLRAALAPLPLGTSASGWKSCVPRRMQAVPSDNLESRVEFRIRKMHSLHSYMLNLNYELELRPLEQDSPQVGCDRLEPAGGVRRHYEGQIRHTGRTPTGSQSARDEPCFDSIASHVERRTVRPQPKRDDADAAGRRARHAHQDCP